ncbi:MAG: glucose-1-phosphate cytidylyltransferase [Methyloceanibacter sp.]|uniref:sugar phosphate nucleotidyltransferase n=1 Tax=Methyloceanibacter sp. TaxID=1965321 RepID=UPI001D4485D0|nr:sugar phosphate nucleotidyltransferase [Methyloceanibacter sp.]MCB1441985.1 glucose-1-phosphate cytidylyltransferase [Methyloceanibacter sp.]
MKVVLFCGGLGTRIREYSEAIPKPMIPIGGQPILWHIMQWYSSFGHRDFTLCLGHRANVVKEFFLGYRREIFTDCVVSNNGADVELINAPMDDWRVAMIDTGIWRNVGERLWAVRHQVQDEEMFLANYSDGLAEVDLDWMVAEFKASGKIACFLAVPPSVTFHLADIGDDNRVRKMTPAATSDLWINGGFFIFRREIFDYMRPGEELVVEPFARLIENDQLLAFKHHGFWRAMDTLRDRQLLEEMVEQGRMPWDRRETLACRMVAE